MESLEQNKDGVVTVVDYCRNVTAVTISDDAIYMIISDRGLSVSTPLEEVTKKDRDLLKADLYMFCQTMPEQTAQVKDADNGWSHSDGGVRMTAEDKKVLRRLANDIYYQYGESSTGGQTVRILGGGFSNIKKPLR